MWFSGSGRRRHSCTRPLSGGHGEGDPPLPFSNRVVKPLSADGTWWETARESRTPPELLSESHSARGGFLAFWPGSSGVRTRRSNRTAAHQTTCTMSACYGFRWVCDPLASSSSAGRSAAPLGGAGTRCCGLLRRGSVRSMIPSDVRSRSLCARMLVATCSGDARNSEDVRVPWPIRSRTISSDHLSPRTSRPDVRGHTERQSRSAASVPVPIRPVRLRLRRPSP